MIIRKLAKINSLVCLIELTYIFVFIVFPQAPVLINYKACT